MIAVSGFGKDFPIVIYVWENENVMDDNEYKQFMESLEQNKNLYDPYIESYGNERNDAQNYKRPFY
jgi:hypothetical protein